MPPPLRWLVRMLPALGVLLLLYLGGRSPDPSHGPPVAQAPPTPAPRAPVPDPAETKRPPLPSPVMPGDEPRDVPRILPATAAIEDLRDALAGTADKAGAAHDAFLALRAIAAGGGAPAEQLRAHVIGLVGPTLRRAAMVALGADATPQTRRWLLARLGDSTPGADSLSALLALSSSDDPASQTVALHARLRIGIDLIAGDRDTEAATRTFLAGADQELVRESSAIVATALAEPERLRWLLDSRGAVSPYVSKLDDAQRRELAEVVRRVARTDTRTREVLLTALR